MGANKENYCIMCDGTGLDGKRRCQTCAGTGWFIPSYPGTSLCMECGHPFGKHKAHPMGQCPGERTTHFKVQKAPEPNRRTPMPQTKEQVDQKVRAMNIIAQAVAKPNEWIPLTELRVGPVEGVILQLRLENFEIKDEVARQIGKEDATAVRAFYLRYNYAEPKNG